MFWGVLEEFRTLAVVRVVLVIVADAEGDGGEGLGREQTYGAERSCFLFRIGSAMLISRGWGREWFLMRSGRS